jgi:hypothetical protein
MSGRTRITFKVIGNTNQGLQQAAEAEIVRFYQMTRMHETFHYTIEAEKPIGSDTYVGIVTAER